MTDRELATVMNNEAAAETNGHLREFWINDLEVAHDQLLEQAIRPGYMDEWIEKQNERQIDVLRRNLGLTGIKTGRGKLKAKKDELRPDNDELLPYVLVKEFARFKSRLATIEAARIALPPNVMELCAKGDDDYDTLALCFAIYHHDSKQLCSVLHLDRIHKTGFARMKMKDGPRRPKQQLTDYLKRQAVEQLLAAFDESKADGRTSSFKNIIITDDHCHVFIRRCEKPSLILQGSDVVHGHRPEWIVLQFFDGAKRVNISSLSVSDSLEIANRIASEYFSQSCEYENESEITFAKQIDRFLAQLKDDADEEMVLVELVVGNTPLLGAPAMTLTDRQSKSIGPAIKQFEQNNGEVLAALDNIESIKVFYRKKRVKLITEKLEESDEEYIVRYSDHQLNPKERRSFEDYMRKTHGIPVLSTEKRFKKSKH